MPKISYISITIAFVAFGLLSGCGSGDKGPVSRLDMGEITTGATDTTTGGGPGGGSGGGACVITYAGYTTCVDTAMSAQFNQSYCQTASGSWNAGQTCTQLGY